MAIENDSDLLITFVELQPILWDKNVANYKKNEKMRIDAWNNVCIGLEPDFQNWNYDEERTQKFYRRVKRRWIHIRDCYMRSHKEKFKNPTHSRREYIHSDLLHFLQKLIPERSTENSLTSAIEKTEREPEIAGPSCNEQALCKKKHDDEVETVDDETSEIENNQNRIMLFFNSIIPDLQNFDENDFTVFRIGILQQIQNIKHNKRNKKQRAQVICVD